jgi:hypothetical protein
MGHQSAQVAVPSEKNRLSQSTVLGQVNKLVQEPMHILATHSSDGGFVQPTEDAVPCTSPMVESIPVPDTVAESPIDYL